jgi:hypothetical protein
MVIKLYIKKHLYEKKKIPQHAWLFFKNFKSEDVILIYLRSKKKINFFYFFYIYYNKNKTI